MRAISSAVIAAALLVASTGQAQQRPRIWDTTRSGSGSSCR
ncbi:MAG TPA: hypothetical protein VJ650_04775 [Gemmatimonadaceae bacterium]|nr:hypothetical protein [Gemmatimonadaceae bacterium]